MASNIMEEIFLSNIQIKGNERPETMMSLQISTDLSRPIGGVHQENKEKIPNFQISIKLSSHSLRWLRKYLCLDTLSLVFL